jgi:acetyl-CoA/propionyl-CoA carboxylase, biotin carboxylase, biotin carboxyl carrier protein
VDVRVRGRAEAAEVAVGDGEPVACSLRTDGDTLVLSYAGATQRYTTAFHDGQRWLGRRGRAWALAETDRLAAAHSGLSGVASAAAGGLVRSPMPGTVLSVAVAEGATVTAGQPLLVIEAMKMEHTIAAPFDGVVTELAVRTAHQVAVDQPLVTVMPKSGAPQ